MALIKKSGSEYVFASGKHANEALSSVAKSDPKYLQWARNRAFDGISDDAYYALEDMMMKSSIPLTPKKAK
jgi:hypothetical protein